MVNNVCRYIEPKIPLHDVQYYSHCSGFVEQFNHREELNQLTSNMLYSRKRFKIGTPLMPQINLSLKSHIEFASNARCKSQCYCNILLRFF